MYSPDLFEKMSHHKASLIILIVENCVQDKPKKKLNMKILTMVQVYESSIEHAYRL